ncbi:MAG: shikimate dehydrogenase, partial [Gammaproteobacteria bacterium]
MKSTEPAPIDFQLDPSQDNYAVFGNPVAHSKSPLIHQAFARQTAQSLIYQAILVPVNEFESAMLEFQRQGGKGLNVTVPFKEQAYKTVTSRSARAKLAGAVNTLSLADNGDITGDNTDGAGLLRDLQQNNIPIEASRILILGAGGAVRGILGPLMEQKPESILIANRTLARADLLVSSFPHSVPLSSCQLNDLANTGRFDLVINAISSGLKGELP